LARKDAKQATGRLHEGFAQAGLFPPDAAKEEQARAFASLDLKGVVELEARNGVRHVRVLVDVLEELVGGY